MLGVGRRHVGLLEPPRVGRDVGLRLEGKGTHVVHEDGDTLLGHGGAEGMHGLERGIELHQPAEILGMASDPRILCGVLQRGRWDRVGGLPLQEGPGDRIEAEENGEKAGSCAWQADDDPRALYAPLLDFGVFSRPALELNAVGQCTGQHFGDQEPSEGREFRLVLAGA